MRSTSAILLEVLKKSLGVEIEGKVAVAYSGGRDSAVLLWAAAQLAGPRKVTALYVDHGWRPAAERADEAALVQLWCGKLGVSLVAFPPPSDPVQTEAAAREHRYACFRAFLIENPDAVVCLGQHADDQAETILMRLLKGRSWQGLGGMPARRGSFRRPFLGVRASLLAEAAREQAVPSHEDSTNASDEWSRNLLRHQVFPLVERRFPRAVEALNEFGLVWGQAQSDRDWDPAWKRQNGGGQVTAKLWDAWSPLRRQAELLALLKGSGEVRMSRRFLEAVCADSRRGLARAGGWTWAREAGVVSWGMVAPRPAKEYFILAERGREYDLGPYRLTWVADPTALSVPGVDPEKPWVWRSVLPGMRFESEVGVWTREQKRKWLGSDESARTALVLQDGLLRAVVDPYRKRVVWSDSGAGKLHKLGIFVTLVTVTPISTE